ncbi:UvrD-helicase domain-containing protein [Paenibacillus sp. DR312]|uniref:UvrD-helicase domain-containing protein n=1 Tax=Paenibacillus sp. DR312 TaxID=2871175 RepID=UPI001C951379|nr:ATP-dependent helicase [Paenibacillus sp. DR312]QZN75461.1 ATP-dependent helicase [Paenibacillus sp. DR312]
MDINEVISADSLICIESNFKVEAGPGSGKTRFLINHIQNVLHNSKRLGRIKKIACITYTNTGVETILNRLAYGNDHVEVSTIHSFLFMHVVKPFLSLISKKHNINIENVKGPTDHLMSGYFNQVGLDKRYKLSNADVIKDLFWFISNDGTCKLHIKGRIADMHSSLYRYKQMFWEKGILHYDDVLAFSWEIMRSYPDVLRVIRAKFPYLYIDEFQDTTPLQTKIIKLIAEHETIIGVIGDAAQSIYSFNGADVTQFEQFSMDNILRFKMKDNHRSTEQIITLLNTIRSDIEQRSPKKKQGQLPTIFIGKPIDAVKYINYLLNTKDIYTLSFSNINANSMRDKLELSLNSPTETLESVFTAHDSIRDRRKTMISFIKAIEYARLLNFKKAFQEIDKFSNGTLDQRSALEIIQHMLDTYSEYNDEPINKLYEKIVSLKVDIPVITKRKSPTKIELFYNEKKYSELALLVQNKENPGFDQTIHQAKGSEFENVLVNIVPPPKKTYSEKRELGFLLNSNIKDKETHRVYYVAASRAKTNLYFCVPNLSKAAIKQLSEICIIHTLE